MVNVPGSAFRRGTVPAGEFTLDYAEAGPSDAPVTLVSLPGSAGLEMSTAKDRLIDTYRVIEINPPGWGGKTDVNRPLPQSELGDLLAEAATTLVDGPFVVLGTSMGGANALYLTARSTDRVRGIVLEGSMSPARPEDLRMPPADEETTPKDPADYPLPPVHRNKPWATHAYMRRQMADRMAMFRWTQADMEATSAITVIRDRRLPVLALLGDADEILLSTQEKTVRETLPRADFRLVPEGGHDLQNTVPDAFVSLTRAFIEGIQP
ncbi:alpha/beta fold hydrolase [Streptomyces sp. BH105]|uniref:alpha/beta fold hydrolase n=1 Tax=Streptomyces sp. BH105 TaxID=3410408 RepID=UPI003CEA0979